MTRDTTERSLLWNTAVPAWDEANVHEETEQNGGNEVNTLKSAFRFSSPAILQKPESLLRRPGPVKGIPVIFHLKIMFRFADDPVKCLKLSKPINFLSKLLFTNAEKRL